MGDTSGRCAICNGAKEEHANSRHAYTENPGELITPEALAKRQQQNSGPQKIPLGLIPAPVNPTITDRLVNVMLDKGLINSDEALYILSGREVVKST